MEKMVDQWELAELAKDLFDLYRELDAQKYDKTQAPRGERMMKPSPGPREPGNGWAISLEAELADPLFEMTRDALNHTSRRTLVLHHDGHRCCAAIRTNSMEIVENFPAVDDLVELMRDQVRDLKHKLRPRGMDEVAKRPERRQSAQSICVRLSGMGHRATPDLLRKWAERGHITRESRDDGIAGYRITEVLDHITETA